MEKADQPKDSLKIVVKRRGNLHQMFTNERKILAPIFDNADKAEIAEDDIEQLKASQQKLLDPRPEIRQLNKEIQNIHVILGEEDTADQDFVDADNISDTHSALLRQIEKILRRDQQLQSSKSKSSHMPIRVPPNSSNILHSCCRKCHCQYLTVTEGNGSASGMF